MRTKLTLIIYLITTPLLMTFGNEVKVSIVGYTLIDNFKVMCSNESIISVDGKPIPFSSFIVSKDGYLTSAGNEINFSKLEIKSDGVTTFYSHFGEQPYRGNFSITYDDNLTIINTVPETEYLSSVLGSEMGSRFSKEALKAQLLCIKNYYNMAKRRNRNRPWDILNTASVMAYRGSAYSNKNMDNIITELKNTNLVLSQNIEPLFFSTSSGYLLSQECFTSELNNPPIKPLVKRDDNLTSPYYSFFHSISEKELLNLLSKEVPIKSIRDIKLNYFKNTECVDFIGFIDRNNKTFWLKGYNFVSLMQKKYGSVFKSIQFNVYKENDYFHFEGNGFGHFVGMSQYGAQEMALEGKSFKDILKFYFPNSHIDIN